MTQDVERMGPPGSRPQAPDRQIRQPTTPAKKWWRRPWIIPLMLVVAAYLQYQLRPFADLKESTAPIPPHPGFSLYYPVLLVHILGGTTAMITVCFQVWPWLRVHHPAIHRVVGRVYVVAAVVGGLAGLTIVRFAPQSGQIGVSMVTLLWMATTLTGFWMARRGRFVEHRRFMLYSFAIVINNFWGVALLELTTHMHIDLALTYFLEGARWVGWIVNLMVMQWWLYHTADRPLELPPGREPRPGIGAESVPTGA